MAHAYNLRAGGAVVTTHGARKWLMGEAVPTQEKIAILARWLNVSASWLLFGDAENGLYELAPSAWSNLSNEQLLLVRDVYALPLPAQRVVRDLVDSLMRAVTCSEHALGQPQAKPAKT